MEKTLLSSVENLYQVFENYSPNGIGGYSEYPNERDEVADRLLYTDLRETDLKDIAFYAFKATYTMGDESNFKYFLPRILELLAAEVLGTKWAIDIRDLNLFTKPSAELATWPEDERTAVENFLQNLWKCMLLTYRDHQKPVEFLGWISDAIHDVEPYLQFWLHCKSKDAAQHLAEAVIEVYEAHIPTKIGVWLVNDAVKNRLEEYFYEFRNDEIAPLFSRAVENFS